MAEILAQRVIDGAPDELVALLRGGAWLEGAVEAAGRAGRGVDATMRAELGRAVARVEVGAWVHAETGEPIRLHDRTIVPLTWEARGVPGLFPVMDATVELRPRGRGRSHVLFWGRYDPPLGRLGSLLDRTLAHHVAEASVEHLLDLLEHRTASDPAVDAASA